ncbi:hypothetical protein B0T22DRAFT_495480 [Podospora appendiculata]|uniref:AB hydrolase-1 domain-containing protein n=1 Tax=Podospora appendiculata TaxID=314037 RepID=A0AAE1CF30_9PEZI|nr:hypothetical protein B0T22DRAFT_495480 [Podospora appendiculata]
MKKTLLLCFIHGFKGNDSTFGEHYAFTRHLQRLLAAALPKISIEVVVYPTYETRGDLGECVARFRDWLMNKVIDLEVAANTPSPTIDPSVRVVLVGHSMGGIVAAETAIELASEQPIHNSTNPATEDPKIGRANASPPPRPPTPNSLMFPYIQGVLAFDTPFLGISPGVVAHGAEGHYATASATVAQLSGLTGLWGGTKATAADAASSRKTPVGALPAPEASKKEQEVAAGWGKWGKIAMVAGAVGAVAAGGAAAYLNRDQITQGLTWATSHLEFVGCLARKEELRRRVAYMVRLNKEIGVGFGNLYTRLGQGAGAKNVVSGSVLGTERTFCVVPRKDEAGDWREAANTKATDETVAHMSMFEPKENPGYEKLAKDARDMVASWLRNDWYESSGNIIEA